MMGDLTENFSSKEMECKCGCGICNVSMEFIDLLQMVRDLCEIPFTITSGCRCLKHNRSIGSKDTSDHVTSKKIQCEGVDIVCNNSEDRFVIVEAATLCMMPRIGISKHFVHLGTKKSNPQNVMWVY